MEQTNLPQTKPQQPSPSWPKCVGTNNLTIDDAANGLSLAAIAREHGMETLEAVVLSYLAEADIACGGGNTPQALAIYSRLLIDRWKGRTANALVLALKAGINSGKIYGKMTYPIIAEWLNDHEDKMEQEAYRKHMASK